MQTLFYNARFYTMNQKYEYFTACLVENGIIQEIYKDQKPDFQGRQIDLNGACVLPGFIDTHTHSFEGGLYSNGVDCSQVKDLKELFTLLGDAAPISQMIFAWNLDENALKEKRFPTIEELDSVVRDLPLLLRRVDGHSCLINSKALKMIDWHYKIPSQFNGLLKGDLNDNAAHWFHKNLSESAVIEAYEAAQRIALASGHTTIHTMIGDAKQDILHYRLMKDNLKHFTIDYKIYPQSFNTKQALENGATRIGGCILADGSFGSHTAALTSPYIDMPTHSGNPYHTQKYWDQFVSNCHQKNLQVGVHCIGDFAINQIVTAIEKAQLKKEKDLRHQIIHCELVDDNLIKRMADNQISAVMQPAFDRYWGGKTGFYQKVLGLDRAYSCNRFKSLVNQGVLVTGGSDWYITPVDALFGIDSAVNIHNPDERLNVFDAISLYTSNAAKLSFDEDRIGTLSIGKQADFVCLDHDIFNYQNIDQIKVTSVYKKGINAFSC
ncbi:MAG TPA: amidohydrolase family protein [Candidatus Cloacimonadota bacterium]|nr:amidohydrolase family protein [Candidatus Cloacimonadota bacterium]